MIRLRNLSVIPLLIIALSACGYHFPGGGELPGGVQRVAMGVFENRSGETGLEGIVSNDIVNEFTRNGRKMSYQSQGADAVLTGIVMSVTTQAISRESTQNELERRVTVRVSLKLVASDGTVLWGRADLSENEEYAIASNNAKSEAIAKLSQRLAEKVYYQLTDQF